MLKMRHINVFFLGKCLSKGLMRKYQCIIMFRKLGICSNCVRQGTQTLLILCLRGVLKASGASGPPDENRKTAQMQISLVFQWKITIFPKNPGGAGPGGGSQV